MAKDEPGLFDTQRPTRRSNTRRVKGAFNACPGLTADEVGLMLQLEPHIVRPRISELVKRGDLVDTGRRRPGISGHDMTVWRERDEGEAK